MIEVVSYYPQEINMLEWLLIVNHFDYTVKTPQKSTHNIGTPYLIVDGVPLDLDRAIKWIEEKVKEVQR